MTRLELPAVTLCAATSVNIDATVAAIVASTDQVLFGEVLLFTDSGSVDLPQDGRVVQIAPLRSGRDYSEFMLDHLVDYVRTDHCLVIQWDGFVVNAGEWHECFTDCDYIGSPWPQFSDAYNVGNGGFSFRSRRLLEACRVPGFVRSHPEDVAIGRLNRDFLEREHGIVFAAAETAARFAVERSIAERPTFGFHGLFNMIPILGVDRFWQLYRGLTDRSAVFHDYALVMQQLGSGRNPTNRRMRLTLDLLKRWAGKPTHTKRRP